MDIKWNPEHLDLETLIQFSKNDKSKMYKYLVQFQELIPIRMSRLKEGLASGDKKMVRQILHKISPQLQFFGIPNVMKSISQVEVEQMFISMDDLKSLVNGILLKLEEALKEVEIVLENNFE